MKFFAIVSLFLTATLFSLFASQLPPKELETMQPYSVLQKPDLAIVGIECRTSNAPDAASYDIPKHWNKFFSEETFNKIPNKASNEVIALYCDYEGDYTKPYSLVIGCAVTSSEAVPEGMVLKVIPAGPYAILPVNGKFPQSITETWNKVWQTMEPQRAYTGDYEVYKDLMVSGLPNEIDVVIALKEEALN